MAEIYMCDRTVIVLKTFTWVHSYLIIRAYIISNKSIFR